MGRILKDLDSDSVSHLETVIGAEKKSKYFRLEHEGQNIKVMQK